MLASAVALACSYTTAGAPPVVPGAFFAMVTSNTSGTAPGVPKGVQTYTQYAATPTPNLQPPALTPWLPVVDAALPLLPFRPTAPPCC